MTDSHPTPPPELVQQLRSEAPHNIRDTSITRELHLIAAAYRAGADQELEACCEWMRGSLTPFMPRQAADRLRAARRPKSPSLKEQALAALAAADGADHPVVATVLTADQHAIIRRALEALPE